MPTDEPHSYGHLAYREVQADRLVMLPNETLTHIDAAEAFLRMNHAATAAGVPIIPRVPFRAHKRQERAFRVIAERKQLDFAGTVRRVAPVGFSEHHTGYAVDVCDPPVATRRERGSFHRSAAYAWMIEHAERFGFERSFPRHNVFGVVFEPWHWRWVGDERARTIFATARAIAKLGERHPELREVIVAADATAVFAAVGPELRGALQLALDGHAQRIAV